MTLKHTVVRMIGEGNKSNIALEAQNRLLQGYLVPEAINLQALSFRTV
jgi:hypothetical protein